MKIRATSNAPSYVRKFQGAMVASAIATFLGACAGGTGEEAGNGATTGTTLDIGAAVEATADTNTGSNVIGSGADVEVTTDTDSTDVDSVVDVSEGNQTDSAVDVEAESTIDTVGTPDTDQLVNSSGTDVEVTPGTDSAGVDSVVDISEGVPTDIEVDSTDSIPDNALGLIQAHPELGLYATAIQSSGLMEYLADPGQRVTVFALSNNAFESLSTIQRDALFNDPDRLNTLVRSTTIHDTRITASTAGVVDDTQALSNGSLTIEREGNMISVVTSDYYSTVAVEVTSTLVSDEVAIHIIDDFINIPATFFPPDPGSIMERLLAGGTSRFSDYISVTRWYRELGNSEGEWTVFVPSVFSTSDIEPYIVASTANGPIIVEAGTLTSVDGSSRVIENVGGAWTFDNREISEFYALQVNNGHVHRLAWPLGVDGHPTADPGVGGSVYDTIFLSTEHTSLLAAIDAAGLADILDDEAFEFTVFAPNDAAFNAAVAALPTGDDLLNLLDFHIVEGTYDSVALTELVGLAVEANDSALPTLLEGGWLTFNISAEGQGLDVNGNAIVQADIYLSGEETVDEVTDEVATSVGVVHSIGAVLTPPAATEVPDETDNPDVPVTDVGPVLTAMQADEGGFTKALAALSGFEAKFDEEVGVADPWSFFIPTDAALAAADTTLDEIVAQGEKKTVAVLLADGSVTTRDGSVYAVAGSDESDLTIGGAPATVIGDGSGAGVAYKLTAVPVAN